MGLWSWLFPSDEDLLRRARARMEAGRWADARKVLLHCKAPEAEKLYDECSAAIEKGERATVKKRLQAEGFHGWKIEVSVKSKKLKAELETLLTEELDRVGIDLALPEIDEKAFKAAVARAQKRVKSRSTETAAIRLIPVMDEKLAKLIGQ